MSNDEREARGEFDYVIVGAGSAGCVLANRLTEDPNISVCLLEAGGPDKDPRIHAPVGFAFLSDSSTVNWSFETVPQPRLEWTERLSTARSSAWRFEFHKRDDLHPRRA